MGNVSNGIVSVIIVAGGSKEYLKSCLDSVIKQTYEKKEIAVIDNSLDPDFSREFSKAYQGVRFLPSQSNLFYCEALNKGIESAKGEFILCLNDDVSLDRGFVKEALAGFSLSEKVGMVSGKILRCDGKTIDSAGLFLSVFRSANETGYGITDNANFDKKRYIFGVNGAVAFYRRQMLEEIKIDSEYFDRDFRFFYEDLDVAWRAQNLGWKGFYIPTAISYHVRGGTARQPGSINRRFARRFLGEELHFDLVKNRYLAIIKNESVPGFILHLPFILFYDIFAWGFILFFRIRLIKRFILKRIPVSSAFRKRLLLLRKKSGIYKLKPGSK